MSDLTSLRQRIEDLKYERWQAAPEGGRSLSWSNGGVVSGDGKPFIAGIDSGHPDEADEIRLITMIMALAPEMAAAILGLWAQADDPEQIAWGRFHQVAFKLLSIEVNR